MGKDQQLKTIACYFPYFLWLVKSEELVNDRTVDHLEKCDLFYSQYVFRSSRVIADLLTVVSDRIFFFYHVDVHLYALNRAHNNLNKKLIIQVDTNCKPYYVNQESKDDKKHIYSQRKYNLLTADHHSVNNCNKTGS